MVMRGKLLTGTAEIDGALWHVTHVEYNRLEGLPGRVMAILDRDGAKQIDVDDTSTMIIVDGPFESNGYAFYDVIVPDGMMYTLCTYENEVLE